MATHVQNRRVGFRALPPPNISNAYSSGSDSEEDEEERLRREEEAEENALSRRYGEAGEAPNNKKRDAEKTEEEIEAEYARRAKKKPRPTLTLNQVIPKLPFIKNEFAASLKYPRKANKIDSAASFSCNLQRAYKNFCYDLFPSMAYEDVLVKIESFGSKKELKSYLQTMRDDVRKQHLEKIYGETKAEQFLQELEHGLKQQQLLQEEDRMDDLEESSAPPVENPYNLRGHGDASTESVEENQQNEGSQLQQDQDKSETSENQQDNNTGETPTENSRGNQEVVDNNVRNDDAETARTSVAVEKRKIYESSSDEEEEADFLDIVGKPADDDQAPTDAAAKEANNNTAEKSKEEENVEVSEDSEDSTTDTDKAAVEETNTTHIDTNDEEKSGSVADGSNEECGDDHAEVLDVVGKPAKGGETGAKKNGEQLGTPSFDRDSNEEDVGTEVVGNAMDVDSEESVDTETQDKLLVSKESTEQPPTTDSFLSHEKETVPASKTVGTSVETDSSSETRTIVPTLHTDDSVVFTTESDETATIVPTQATQGGLSDETATIVPTLSETQQTTSTPLGPSSSTDEDVIHQERENKAHPPTGSATADETGIDSTE